MEPSVASTTKIHRAGLSTITGLAWGVWAVALSWTTTGRGDSEGNRLFNRLNEKKKKNLLYFMDLSGWLSNPLFIIFDKYILKYKYFWLSTSAKLNKS